MKTHIDQSLSKYTENHVEEPSPVNTLISHILQYPTTTGKDQFSLLSSISNYHWVNNITLSTNHQHKKLLIGLWIICSTILTKMNKILTIYLSLIHLEYDWCICWPVKSIKILLGHTSKIILIMTFHLNKQSVKILNMMIIHNMKTSPQRRKGNNLQDLLL